MELNPRWGFKLGTWSLALRVIESEGGRKIGELHKGLTDIISFRGTLFMVSDNGGEINVEAINHLETLRSVPTTAYGCALDAGTIGYRVACALKGVDIDYTADMSEYLEVI